MRVGIYLIGLLFFLIILPLESVFANTKSEPRKQWNAKMQKIYQTTTDLLIDTSSDARFNQPSNFKRIEKNVQTLATLAHEISMSSLKEDGGKKEMVSPDLDPSVPIIASLFEEQSKRAYDAYKSGHRAYSRNVIRTITGYCIACHTRSASGPDFSKIPTRPEVEKFSHIEKALFFIATRRFDPALEELNKIIIDQSIVKNNPLEWEKAIRYSLALSVRYYNDPKKSLGLIKNVIANETAPIFIREDAELWKKSLEEWANEGTRKLTTEDGYYAEAMRLVTKAKDAQRFPADRAGDIYYYRLTTIVHEMLKNFPEGSHTSEALLLLGLSYESLKDLNLWNLHEMYYESCIRKTPHSEVARSCYRHYEQTIYVGFSGSGGFSVPDDIKAKLKELSKLSGPSDKP